MYLFTRAGRLAPGAFREGAAFVAAITEKVNQDTGLDVHTWAASMSPELGTVVWANFVESLEELEAAQDKLNVSDQFIELAEKVTGARDPSAPLPSYVGVARAIAANGHVSEAMAAGVEIAEASTRITGIPTMFLADVTGDYGGCRWNTGYADIGGMERAEAALVADESWLKLIDRIGPAFQEGATQSIYRRLI